MVKQRSVEPTSGHELVEKERVAKKLPPPLPQKTLLYLNETGLTRGERPAEQMFASGVVGGAYLAWGGAAFVFLGGGSAEAMAALPGLHKCMSALIFPMGLSAIVVTGTDLLTSNMCYAAMPLVSGDPRRSLGQKLTNLARLWVVTGTGNLVGSLGLAVATSYLFAGTPAGAFAAGLASKKVAGSLGYIFCKAIGANWLVNLAVFQAATADTTPGKAAMLWLPITVFVALGLEHSVANFYLLPLGALCGAPIQAADMLHNLAPCLLGNAVGASVFFAYFHWKALDPPTPPYLPPNNNDDDDNNKTPLQDSSKGSPQ